MKLFLILFLVFLCGYVGYGLSSYYKNRRIFFEEFISLIENVNLDINFSREKIAQILKSQKINSRALKKTINNFIAVLETRELECGKLFEGVKLLKDDEKFLIFSFFRSLGKFDVELQSLQLSQFKEKFLNSLQVCSSEEKKYSPILLKLAIMVGALLGLIFI